MPPFSMPAPATVPLKEEDTGDGYRTPRGLMALLCVLLMISTACAFFFTGLADGLLKKVGIPTWSEMAEQMNEPAAEAPPQASASLLEAQTLTPSADEEASVVALEQVLTQSQGGIAPASSNLPSLSSFTVTPPESSPNDTLLFTLQTSAKVIDVKLYTISLQPIPIKDTNKAPMGDGMTWQLTTTLTQPYEGEVRAILKYGENLWADGLLRCSVSVKATATAEVPQETEKSTEESTTEKTIAPAPGNEKPIAENSSSQNAPLERPPFDNPTLKTPVLAQ